jgi:molybdenum cofactor cytidylyltransferase
MNSVVGLLLAAGFGRRYGSQKLLEPLPSGDCVAGMACRNLRAGTDHVVAVVRPDDPDLSHVLAQEGAEVIHFDNAHLGMGATLAFGVSSTATSLGWLIALGDMPSIKVSTIHALTEALRSGESMVIPIHQGQRGHPVGFGSRHYERLTALKGDQGARAIVEDHAADGIEIPFDDAGILLDIDTPRDLVSFAHKRLS